jgi:hypothetical protein
MTVWLSRWHRPIPDCVRTIVNGQANVTLNVTLPGQGPELDLQAVTGPGRAGGREYHRIPARVTLLSPASKHRRAAAERVFEIQ